MHNRLALYKMVKVHSRISAVDQWQVEQSNFSAQLRHCIQSKECGDVIKDGVGEN